MFSQRNSPLGAILALAHILPMITTVLSLPSFNGGGVAGAVDGNGYGLGNRFNFNRFNPSRANGFFYRHPSLMFEDDAAAADNGDAVGSAEAALEDAVKLSADLRQLDEFVTSAGAGDQNEKRSVTSEPSQRPARSRIQKCGPNLLTILDYACMITRSSRRPAKRSQLSTVNADAAESSTGTNSAVDAIGKERPKRDDLVTSCCHNDCSVSTLLSFCHLSNYY